MSGHEMDEERKKDALLFIDTQVELVSTLERQTMEPASKKKKKTSHQIKVVIDFLRATRG